MGKSKTTLPLEPLMAAASLMGKLAIPIGMVTVAASVVAGEVSPTITSKSSSGEEDVSFQALEFVINVVSNNIVESAVDVTNSPFGLVVALMVLLSHTAMYRLTGRGRCGCC